MSAETDYNIYDYFRKEHDKRGKMGQDNVRKVSPCEEKNVPKL
jgi:hypothetical protein